MHFQMQVLQPSSSACSVSCFSFASVLSFGEKAHKVKSHCEYRVGSTTNEKHKLSIKSVALKAPNENGCCNGPLKSRSAQPGLSFFHSAECVLPQSTRFTPRCTPILVAKHSTQLRSHPYHSAQMAQSHLALGNPAFPSSS